MKMSSSADDEYFPAEFKIIRVMYFKTTCAGFLMSERTSSQDSI